MSRTDKTAPYTVKYHFEPTYLEEHHDHRNHECNLPPRPRVGQELKWGSSLKGDCFWWPSHEFWRSKDAQCPCYMCSHDAYLSSPRRKTERREGRRYTRDGWMKEY